MERSDERSSRKPARSLRPLFTLRVQEILQVLRREALGLRFRPYELKKRFAYPRALATRVRLPLAVSMRCCTYAT